MSANINNNVIWKENEDNEIMKKENINELI